MHSSACWSDYVAGIWQRRYFWMSLVKLDLQSRYRRSVLGIGWSLLQPIAMTIVLCVMFHSIMGVELKDYAPFILSGMAMWNFISSSILEGCISITVGEKYIRTHAAPMAIYPLRTILSVTFHFLLTLLVMLVATALLTGIKSPLALTAIVPAILMFFILGWALSTIFGFINVYFPDTQYLAQVGLQLLFYLSPTFYPKELLQKRGIGAVLKYNPLGSFFDLVREPVLNGNWPSLESTLVCAVTVTATALAALFVLRRCEPRIIFHL